LGDQALRLLQDELGRQRLRWAITSHAIRRLYSPGTALHQVTTEWLQSVLASRAALYQVAAPTIGARLAVADA
jgi:hypothetical protein